MVRASIIFFFIIDTDEQADIEPKTKWKKMVSLLKAFVLNPYLTWKIAEKMSRVISKGINWQQTVNDNFGSKMVEFPGSNNNFL